MPGPRDLVERFRVIHQERMQGLPIVHPRLEVEAVGFAPWGEHELGVLITPWFMNLVLLPAGSEYDELSQGATVEFRFPSGPCELTVSRDEVLGTFLTAVLFRAVVDFPHQSFAREVAVEALANLLAAPPVDETKIGRREFLGGTRSS